MCDDWSCKSLAGYMHVHVGSLSLRDYHPKATAYQGPWMLRLDDKTLCESSDPTTVLRLGPLHTLIERWQENPKSPQSDMSVCRFVERYGSHAWTYNYPVPTKIMKETPQTYIVRCTDCGKTRQISHDNGNTSIQTEDTRHSPRSKAVRIQRRVADKCGNCGAETFGIKPKDD